MTDTGISTSMTRNSNTSKFNHITRLTVLFSSGFTKSIVIADGHLWKSELLSIHHLDVCRCWILRIGDDVVLYLIDSQSDGKQQKHDPNRSQDDVSVAVQHVPVYTNYSSLHLINTILTQHQLFTDYPLPGWHSIVPSSAASVSHELGRAACVFFVEVRPHHSASSATAMTESPRSDPVQARCSRVQVSARDGTVLSWTWVGSVHRSGRVGSGWVGSDPDFSLLSGLVGSGPFVWVCVGHPGLYRMLR